MKSNFILALLAAVSLARTDTDVFIQFTAEKSKSYKTIEEFKKRKETFEKNHQLVLALNKSNKGQDVKFGDNFTSDWEDDEFKVMLGLATSDVATKQVSLLDDTNDAEGRHLQSFLNVDWVAAENMHDVKNQGSCGSCWAFAAATALEGVQSISDGGNPKRISEQQAVDCSSGSCAGGWMSWAWDYWALNGAMSNGDYNYTAIDETCKTDSAMRISTPAAHGQITGSTSNVVTQLQQGPMTVAVAAGNNCWRWYTSGILSESDSCPTWRDHGVTLVAYTAGMFINVCTYKWVWTCTSCIPDDFEILQPDDFDKIVKLEKGSGRGLKAIEYQDCCQWKLVKSCSFVQSKSYWTIQNSWGSGWGNKGFMNLEVSAGLGVSGINTTVEWVTVV